MAGLSDRVMIELKKCQGFGAPTPVLSAEALVFVLKGDSSPRLLSILSNRNPLAVENEEPAWACRKRLAVFYIELLRTLTFRANGNSWLLTPCQLAITDGR